MTEIPLAAVQWHKLRDSVPSPGMTVLLRTLRELASTTYGELTN